MSDAINNGVVPSIEQDTTTSGTSSLENAKSTVINSEVRYSICQQHIHFLIANTMKQLSSLRMHLQDN